jgi:hypothetical protein
MQCVSAAFGFGAGSRPNPDVAVSAARDPKQLLRVHKTGAQYCTQILLQRATHRFFRIVTTSNNVSPAAKLTSVPVPQRGPSFYA